MSSQTKSAPANFWTTRYETLGHTGWKNPVVYAYDQIERLAIVSDQIDTLAPKPLTALDFGCGTGDFSRLMLAKDFTVWGYDPYVKPDICSPDFNYLPELPLSGSQNVEVNFGLILCVTVLDHIVDNPDFRDRLLFFRSNISEHGCLLMVEYALDAPRHEVNQYQAYRTLDLWQAYLTKAGWYVKSMSPVPHPVAAPSMGFSHYHNNLFVRIINRMRSYRGLTERLYPILQQYAKSTLARYGIGQVDQSPLKLMVCLPT